jgi:2-polyprenyl-3-methyl-5-hydroxy-6-metoxy-1,4-benzoquinol methylase
MTRIASLIAWLPRRFRSTSPQQWDAQYACGNWDYLRSVGELARYSVIAGYCRQHKPEVSVCDVGCGEGILERALWPAYSHYLGIDVSDAAIRRARAANQHSAAASYQCADALLFDTAEHFDVIVFNECLYYFPQPGAVLHRYEKYLNADGAFVVSNVIRRRSRAARLGIRSAYPAVDRTYLRNAAGARWEVALLSRLDRGSCAH